MCDVLGEAAGWGGRRSHGMLYLGDRRTVVKQGELKTGPSAHVEAAGDPLRPPTDHYGTRIRPTITCSTSSESLPTPRISRS